MKTEPSDQQAASPEPRQAAVAEPAALQEPEGVFNPPIPGAFPLLGLLKEPIWYAPDFDEPLEDFRPYM